jgi:hypothetical protein
MLQPRSASSSSRSGTSGFRVFSVYQERAESLRRRERVGSADVEHPLEGPQACANTRSWLFGTRTAVATQLPSLPLTGSAGGKRDAGSPLGEAAELAAPTPMAVGMGVGMMTVRRHGAVCATPMISSAGLPTPGPGVSVSAAAGEGEAASIVITTQGASSR